MPAKGPSFELEIADPERIVEQGKFRKLISFSVW